MATDLGNNIAIPHGSEKEIIKSKIVIATLTSHASFIRNQRC